MKILISGSSGFIGEALIGALKLDGHQVVRLVRKKNAENDSIFWDPEKSSINVSELEGFDAVINLSGENVSSGYWTAAKKKRIADSRIQSTKFLCESLSALKKPPKVLVNASAIGIYGSRGDEELTEDSSYGNDFLANVCKEWEAAAEPAVQRGIRVVFARFGVVFSPNGGALKKMLNPFRLGLGGVIGSGKQYMSWITLQDTVSAIKFLLHNESCSGPYNVVAPFPVTNEHFTKTLGNVVQRPTVFGIPAFAARLIFGEMADALLLSSARVIPKRLIEAGFIFQHPELEEALKTLLERSA